MSKNLYKTLGIGKTASSKDIKAAFYDLSKRYHPDQNPDAEAVIKFRDVCFYIKYFAHTYRCFRLLRRMKSYQTRREDVCMTRNCSPPRGQVFDRLEPLLTVIDGNTRIWTSISAIYNVSKNLRG